jgi:hypothetical protein
MRLRRTTAAALVLAALAAAGPGTAEDLDPAALFESAKAAYDQQKYGKAAADLKLLLGEIGRRRGESLKGFLPVAPAGWTAGEAEVTDAGAVVFAAGLSVRRSYSKGDAEVNVELTVDSPATAGFMAMFQMAGQMPGYAVVTVRGRRALLELDASSKTGTLSLVLGGNTALLQIRGNGVSKADLVDVFGGATNLDGLDRALLE